MENSYKSEWTKFFEAAFASDPKCPLVLRRTAERLCRAYGIRGSCDPMYMVNVIAQELGLGDGKGNFDEQAISALDRLIVKRSL